MSLKLTGRISASDILLDSDLRAVEVITTASASFLYAATGQNGGISVYQVVSGGLARLSDSAYFSGSGLGMGDFAPLSMDGDAQLMLAGTGAGRLLRFRLDDADGLGNSGTLDLPGNGSQSYDALTGASLRGASAVYGVDAGTGMLGGWISDGAGRFDSAAALRGKAAGFALSGEVSLAVAGVGGRSFLLAADAGGQGVHSYAINKLSGRLAATDTLGAPDGLGVALPTALETVSAFGSTWVVLAAAGSQSLSVMELSSTGQLTATDHVLDTLATRFGGVAALEVVKIDGRVLVLAGGADDGITLFSLVPGGRLVHLETLGHDTGLGLENVTGIAAVRMGDTLQVFVTSGGDAGITQLSLPLADFGAVIRPSADGAGGPVAGTTDGDVIVARQGTVTLNGLDGDDILVSGAGGGVLTGGGGSDTFVASASKEKLVITDFQAGIDRIDLSGLPMLRSLAQIKAKDLAHGVELSFNGTTIKVLSAGGAPLTLADIWPDGFETPDRAALPGGPLETLTRGTGAGDRIVTAAANDTVRAGGGGDTVKTARGDDRLFGGSGGDTLLGGAGADLLSGQGGDDRLAGGTGRDRLAGGKGRDLLSGDGGNDSLTGGGGADTFRFASGHGNDRITDFDLARDHIRLNIDGLDFAGLAMQATGTGLLIDTGAGSILLHDTAAADLTADHFLFG